MAVHDRRRRRLAEDFKLGDRLLDPIEDAVDVNGLEAVDAMALDAALVGLEQHVGADDRVAGDADGYEGVGDEVVKRVPIYCDFGHFQVPFFNCGSAFFFIIIIISASFVKMQSAQVSGR